MSVTPRAAISIVPSPHNFNSLKTRYLQRLVATAMLSIGFKPARSLARWFAREVFELNTPSRQTATDHIRAAFDGQLTDQQCDELCKACFEHTADLATELLYARRRLRPSSLHHHVVMPDELTKSRELQPARTNECDRDLQPFTANGPTIFVTTYFGNVFVGVVALAHAIGPLHVILDDWAYQAWQSWTKPFNETTLLNILPRSEAATRLPQLLDAGHNILLIGEHVPASGRGHVVPFLNTTQCCYPTIALLSIMHQAPIVVFAAERAGDDFDFQLRIECTIDPPDRHDVEPNLLTRQYMAALERIIRRCPEQYLWTRSWIP